MNEVNVLSEQEIFNQVADHLLTQKKKSAIGNTCMYRGPNGLKCAVGCLLADTEIDTGHNKNTVYSIDLPDRLQGRVDFLRALQVVHDQNKPSRWIEKLSVFAKKHKLSASVLKKYRKPKKTIVVDVEVPLTNQQVFDTAVKHLLTQKKRALLDSEEHKGNKTCAYLNNAGLRCAVGGLLTDEEALKFKNEDVGYRIILEDIKRFTGYSDSLISQLQNIHDSVKPSRWYEKLSALANEHGFDRTVLNTFKKAKKNA